MGIGLQSGGHWPPVFEGLNFRILIYARRLLTERGLSERSGAGLDAVSRA